MPPPYKCELADDVKLGSDAACAPLVKNLISSASELTSESGRKSKADAAQLWQASLIPLWRIESRREGEKEREKEERNFATNQPFLFVSRPSSRPQWGRPVPGQRPESVAA